MMGEMNSAVIAIAVAIVCALVIAILDVNWGLKYWKKEAKLEERARKGWVEKCKRLEDENQTLREKLYSLTDDK